MPPRLNTIPDPSLGLITCHNGMNTVDKPLQLDKSQCQTLKNMFPGKPFRLRNGMRDLFADNRPLIIYGEPLHSEYTPYSIYVKAPDGDEYILAWSKVNQMYPVGESRLDKMYVLEAINLTDNKRQIITHAYILSFGDEDEEPPAHFKFLKLHGVIYCACDKKFSGLVSPFIIYWDDATTFWKIRGMGITESPNMVDVYVIDNNPIDDNNYIYNVAMTDNRVVVFNRTLFMIGHLNHVYSSEDGINWKRIGTLYPGYSYWSLTVFNGRMWVIGGVITDESDPDYGATHGMVLSSNDGKNWQLESELYSSSTEHAAVVFQNRLCIIGGDHRYPDSDGTPSQNNAMLQYSYDGVTWYTDDHERYALRMPAAVVYKKSLYIIGGVKRVGDVLTLTDEVLITQKLFDWSATDDFSDPIAGAGAFVYQAIDGAGYKETLIVHGGRRNTLSGYSDKIYTRDGSDWVEIGTDAIPTGHSRNPITPFNGKLVLSAGMYGYVSSDGGETWQRATGGRQKGKFVSIAYTFVRRTDPASKLSSYDDYTFEPWEVVGNSELLTGPDEKILTGEVEWTSGTTLTGYGTLFEDELEPGDRIRVNGMLEALEIDSITDQTHLTLVSSPQQPWEPLYQYRFAILPKIGDPITTRIYEPGDAEGPEEPANRYVMQITAPTTHGRLVHVFPALSEDWISASGVTHLRVFTTMSADTEDEAKGITHGYVADVAVTGGTNLYYRHVKKFRDNSTDADIEANIATLQIMSMTQADIKYSPPPLGRYIVWTVSRLVLAGEKGPLYFSEVPGGDKAIKTDNLMKYASEFSERNYFLVSDQANDQKRTGIETLFKDLIEFYENKIYVLINSDRLNEPICICSEFGCPYPNTIKKADHPKLGPCIFFESSRGPAVVLTGNVVKLLTDFPIRELYPKDETATNTLDYWNNQITDWNSRNLVTAHYSNDTYWVHWGDSNATSSKFGQYKCYGYYISSDGTAKGALELVVSSSYEPQSWVNIPDNRVLTLSHKTNRATGKVIYRVTEFLRHGVIRDIFIHDSEVEGETAYTELKAVTYTYGIELTTGAIFLSSRRDLASEIFALFIHATLKNELEDKLIIEILTDGGRLFASGEYTQNRQSGTAGISTSGNYRFRIKALLKPGLLGAYAQVTLKKQIYSAADLEFYGLALQVISRNIPCEFISKISNLTSNNDALKFVAEVDKLPEADIYAEP